MNLPTLIEKQAFQKLPLNLQEFAGARLEPPVSEINDLNLKDKCLKLIQVSYTEQAQFNTEPEILAHQRNALFDELRTNSKFKELTLSEVKRAFKTGIRGESGPFFGMCAKTYHQFLKHYYEKPERVESMKQYLELMNQENKVELTAEEKLKKNKEACVWCFEEYKKTKQIPNGHYKFYQTLLDLGLIKWTKEEKKAISTPIKTQYEKELETSKKRGHISTSQLAELLITLDSNPTLISRVRKVALAKYFDNLIKEGIELKTIIK